MCETSTASIPADESDFLYAVATRDAAGTMRDSVKLDGVAPASSRRSTPRSTPSDDGMRPHIPAPSREVAAATLLRSRALWGGYVAQAQLDPLPWRRLTFDELLARVPAIPALPLKYENGSVFGQSKWLYTGEHACDLDEELAAGMSGTHRPLSVGIWHPTSCTTDGSCFAQWKSRHGNYVAILMFAWAYILCARLIELQGGSMSYTDGFAPNDASRDDHDVVIDLTDLEPADITWWRAILACGWRAEREFRLLPWSVAYDGDQRFLAKTKGDVEGSTHCPSSHDALEMLGRFCSRYDLDDQCRAALAAALILPLHNVIRQRARLPKVWTRLVPPTANSAITLHEIAPQLPRLLTLSCTGRIVSSALWGIFWEPGVDCNLVDAWFLGVKQHLAPLIESGNLELLASVVMHRQPTLAPLWLGSILTTLAPESITRHLEYLDALMGTPDGDAAAWTTSAQSFMDIAGDGPYVEHDTISRDDVFRLQHLCFQQYPQPCSFQSRPLVGFAPCGRVPLSSLDLEIRAHVTCSRLGKRYTGWRWTLADGSTLDDAGRDATAAITAGRADVTMDGADKHVTQEDLVAAMPGAASQYATEQVFRWIETGGYDPAIDPYIPPQVDSDESEEGADSDG